MSLQSSTASGSESVDGSTTAKSGTTLALGGWLRKKAESLEGHVKEMRENTKMIAQDMADTADIVTKAVAGKKTQEERFDATFVERAFGLELDLQKGALVRLVKPGGQAARLGVQEQDRVVSIAGSALPPPPSTAKEIDDFVECVKGKMSNLPRPVTLTFARAAEVPKEESTLPSMKMPDMKINIPIGFSSSSETTAMSQTLEQTEQVVAELQKELAEMRLSVQRYECDAALAREDADKAPAATLAEETERLRADLADMQLSEAWQRQEIVESQRDLHTERSEAEQLRTHVDSLEERLAGLQSGSTAEAAQLRTDLTNATSAGAAAELRLVQLQEECSARVPQEHCRQLEANLQNCLQKQEELQISAEAFETQRAATERLLAEANEEGQCLRQREESATARAQEAEKSLDTFLEQKRGKEIADKQSDRLVAELRREVERLRSEVRRSEEKAAAALASAEANDSAKALRETVSSSTAETAGHCEMVPAQQLLEAEIRIAELLREVAQLRKELSSSQAAASSISVGDSEDSKLLPTVIGNNDVEVALAESRRRSLELETQVSNLQKQLSARPIVFQYGPLPDDALEAEDLEDEDAPPPEMSSAADSSASLWNFAYIFAVCRGGVLWGRRRCFRTLGACRRTGAGKQCESYLRSFTKQLLLNPMLLWFFYTYVLALSAIEVWQQAISTPTVLDPEAGLQVSQGSPTVSLPKPPT
eukprot:TRINITY_DN21876_c1_g1_i1.p1 TRINITY_DN21876_c1_g1~~TRINITY_DN21876_c1_g1_i1.p1  ORF type:complete len:711 (+),score=165.85 TRINITY_DN21876_c1_g1_i1:78-2210(+)